MLEGVFKAITIFLAIVFILAYGTVSVGFWWIALGFGLLSALIGKYRGRKGYWAFLYGFTWGIIPALYYLVVKKIK